MVNQEDKRRVHIIIIYSPLGAHTTATRFGQRAGPDPGRIYRRAARIRRDGVMVGAGTMRTARVRVRRRASCDGEIRGT